MNYDIVFQEVPDEVTLAINLSNCPNRCKGCHSPYLMQDSGEVLNEGVLSKLLEQYHGAITCVCFMGGDADPTEVSRLAGFLQRRTNGVLRTAWYSGRNKLPATCCLPNFNYIKLGAYMENLGGLDSVSTNQRFYRVEGHKIIDMTYRFQQQVVFI